MAYSEVLVSIMVLRAELKGMSAGLVIKACLRYLKDLLAFLVYMKVWLFCVRFVSGVVSLVYVLMNCW